MIRTDVVSKKKPPTSIDLIHSAKVKQAIERRKAVETGLTDGEIARDVGKSPGTLSRIQSGNLALSIEMALKLGRRLFCHPGELHTELIDFTAASSFKNARLFQQIEQLPETDQQHVRAIVETFHARLH